MLNYTSHTIIPGTLLELPGTNNIGNSKIDFNTLTDPNNNIGYF